MAKSFENIQWLVQRNLTSHSDLEALEKACHKIRVDFYGLDIIPFTDSLPEIINSKLSIIYGSTTFNLLASKNSLLRKGVFFDEQSFSIENYFDKWGKHMLNYGAMITSFQELISSGNFEPEQLLFIRPNDDSKSFAGDTIQFKEIANWYHQLETVENTNLSLESKIIVSKPYNIQYEWRLWIVNKQVVAASKYREYFKLKKEEGCPEEVVLFAELRCTEYTPHDVFVMDVCKCGDELFIVECGCFIGAGFYKANIDAIVQSVTAYFSSIIQSSHLL